MGGMRFKDLVKFNEAMLAKQSWHLLNDHNSLFYRVFKAKYFPRGSIFEAKASSGSYAWQSVLKVRNVISPRMLWRVGDGKNIRIYDDNWIPGTNSARILSPQATVLEEATVDCLLDCDLGGWNNHVINQHILPFEAQIIEAIPICVTSQPDCIICPEARMVSTRLR